MVLSVLASVVTAGVGLAACGSVSSSRRQVATTTSATASHSQDVVTIYSSLPLSGPQSAQGNAIVRGIRAGLAALEAPAGFIGDYKVVYHSLNDATRAGWSATLAATRAETAARDPDTILYIGDLDSGATEAALPILNQAGIVEIAPGSSYVGLTNAVAGGVTAADEPSRFYPNAKQRNLLRLVPNEMVQIAAILDAFAKVGPACSRVTAVALGYTPEASSAVAAVHLTAPDYGMTWVDTKSLAGDATTAQLTTYVEALRAQTVDCVVLTGKVARDAGPLVRLIHAYLPHDPVIGTSGFCNAPLAGGPAWYCASPVLPLSAYRDQSIFTQEYRHTFSTSAEPSPYGVYGFVAAELAGYAIEELVGGDVDIRTQIKQALIDGDVDSELIGDFHFDDYGNISDRKVGIYRVDSAGRLALFTVLTPPKVIGAG